MIINQKIMMILIVKKNFLIVLLILIRLLIRVLIMVDIQHMGRQIVVGR